MKINATAFAAIAMFTATGHAAGLEFKGTGKANDTVEVRKACLDKLVVNDKAAWVGGSDAGNLCCGTRQWSIYGEKYDDPSACWTNLKDPAYRALETDNPLREERPNEAAYDEWQVYHYAYWWAGVPTSYCWVWMNHTGSCTDPK